MYEWIDHFKVYIKECENRIKEQKKNITINRLPIVFFSFIFIFILLASAFYLRPTFIGFLIQEPSNITGYIIENNTVYINDSNAFISITPHTITSDGWITINLTSKQFTGDIDVIFATNTDELKPKQTLYYNPRNITTQKSFTCDFSKNNFVDFDGNINIQR